MNDNILENFITYCDNMKIAEEALVTNSKEDYINSVIMYMSNELTKEQLEHLKACMSKMLYNYDLITVNNTVVEDDSVYIQKFAKELRVQGKSEKTISQYIRETQLFLNTIGKSFINITKDDIINYMQMKLDNGVSPSSVDNSRKFIKQFFNYALDNELILSNPFNRVKSIKRNPIKKEILTDEELEELRDACISKRELALIDFLDSTGLRVSEVSNLKMSDVNLTKGTCRVYSTKTLKERTVCLTAKAVKHISDYREELKRMGKTSEYLFVSYRGNNTKLQNASIQKILHTITSRTNIKKHITVHTFRKSLASKLCRRGASPMMISELLGHSFSTSQKHYIKMTSDDVVQQFHSMII